MVKVNKHKDKTLRFQILAVELLKNNFAIPSKVIGNNNGVSFSFDISVEHKLDVKNKYIVVTIHVDIVPNSDTTIKFASSSVACIYAIENFEEIININSPDKTIIDATTTEILNSISLSTTRGVLSQLYSGTYLHNAILPVIDPKSLKPTN